MKKISRNLPNIRQCCLVGVEMDGVKVRVCPSITKLFKCNQYQYVFTLSGKIYSGIYPQLDMAYDAAEIEIKRLKK